MISRATSSWLALSIIALVIVVAADYGIFLYRQRHGALISFVHVRQYVPVKRGNAFLPHLRLPPCWWVSLNRFDWH